MTRELLVPLLAIVLLLNVGVIAYVIGRRGAPGNEPTSQHSEVRLHAPSAAWPSVIRRRRS